jgi:hypothetical protein
LAQEHLVGLVVLVVQWDLQDLLGQEGLLDHPLDLVDQQGLVVLWGLEDRLLDLLVLLDLLDLLRLVVLEDLDSLENLVDQQDLVVLWDQEDLLEYLLGLVDLEDQ